MGVTNTDNNGDANTTIFGERSKDPKYCHKNVQEVAKFIQLN